jgi:hypothetical protein
MFFRWLDGKYIDQ